VSDTTHDAPHATHDPAPKRTPVKRWIVLVLILLGFYFAFGDLQLFGRYILPVWMHPPTWTKPTSPAVVLPGEPTGLEIAGFPITNTLLATFVADIVLILMAFGAWRFVNSGKLVPEGFYNFT